MNDENKKKFQEQYTKGGVKVPAPMVSEVLENKHGIDNPVIDLNPAAGATAHFFTTDGKGVTVVDGLVTLVTSTSTSVSTSSSSVSTSSSSSSSSSS